MLHEPIRAVGQSTLLHAVQHGGVSCMGITNPPLALSGHARQFHAEPLCPAPCTCTAQYHTLQSSERPCTASPCRKGAVKSHKECHSKAHSKKRGKRRTTPCLTWSHVSTSHAVWVHPDGYQRNDLCLRGSNEVEWTPMLRCCKNKGRILQEPPKSTPQVKCQKVIPPC